MPWGLIRLNTGDEIPSISFGTWAMGNGARAIDQVDQALEVGFNHIDTSQSYRNEAEAGQALRDSGIPRSEVFITTKYSGLRDIDTSIQDSLKNLGVSYVDLYLIQSPRLAVPDIPTLWAKMEKFKEDGLARNIGVSNFDINDLEVLLASAKIKPTVNHILLHPYVYSQRLPILEYAAAHGIVIGAYSTLIPITKQPGGPLEKPLSEISAKTGATYDQVLLAWAKAKGVVVITTSSKKSRLEGYIKAGDLELTGADIGAIDAAGAIGKKHE